MAAMMDKKCKNCKTVFSARVADHNRGWARFCSKSCKAKHQERRNGQHAAYIHGRGVSNLHPERLKHYRDDSDPHNEEWRELHSDDHPFSPDALGQWLD